MNYIITDKNELRTGLDFHFELAGRCEGKVIAAGEFDVDDDGNYRVWGGSPAHGIKSKPEDIDKIEEILGKE